jgi:hypothetical protein
MLRKLWISTITLTFAAGLAVVGCRHLQTPQVPAIAANATSEDREMAHADSLAKLGNWEAAGPIFRRLEIIYRQRGDIRSELYARVSRYRRNCV